MDHPLPTLPAIGWEPELDELRERQRIARRIGGPERIARQHAAGKLTVRERIDHMLDPGTFMEIGSIAGLGGTAGRESLRADGQGHLRRIHRRPAGGGTIR